MIRSVVSRLAAAACLLLASSGCLLAQFSIQPSVSAVYFNFAAGTAGPITQQITISSPQTAYFQASTTLSGVTVSPNFGTVNNGGTTLTLRIDNPSVYPASAVGTLNIQSMTSGVSNASIPIYVNPGGTGTGSYVAYPSTVQLSYTPGATTGVYQNVQITGPTSGTFSVSIDGTAAPYLSLSTSAVATGSSVTVTLNPQFAPTYSTQANLRFTPQFSTSGVSTVVVPITLQPYGSSSASITATPASVNFSYPSNTVGALSQTVTLSSAYSIVMTPTFSDNLRPYLSIPYTVSSNNQFQIVLQNPASVPGNISGTLTLVPNSTSGAVQTLNIPVSITPGGTSTNPNLTVSPSPITFNFAAGTAQQQSQQVVVNASSSLALSTSVSGLGNLIYIPSSVYANSPFTITLLSPSIVTSAQSGTVTFTPPAGSGFSAVTATIQLVPSGSSTGGSLSVSPSSLTFNYGTGTTASQTAYLLVSSPVFTNVTITPSSNLSGYFSYPTNTTSGQQIPFTLLNPALVPSNTVGSFTITPTSAGLSSISVPVYINSTSTGLNSIVATPNMVTFNMQLNGAAPPEQTVTLTDPNNFATNITTSVTSDNNFLTLAQSSSTTPSILTLRVNPSAITETRTYSATITVTRLSDRVVIATIPVTLNVTPTVRVTLTPNAANLNSVAGSTTPVTQTVQVAGDASVSFATNVSTTTGGAWLSVSPATGSLGSSVTISGNPSGLVAGTYQGTVTVTVNGSPAASIPVTLNVAPASALQLGNSTLSFNYQVGSGSNPAAQSVSVGSTTAGVALNYTATATSTGNWLSVTPASGTTPGSVSVSVNPAGLAAGTYNGTVQIASSTATNTPQTVNVTLTVTAPALPSITSVLSAASFTPTLVTPGEILTLRGTNMGPATGVPGTVAGGMVGTEAGGVTVTFDGVPAPVLYASATQLNVVAPYDVASRATTRVVVTYNGQSSQPTELRVTDTAPALFAISGGNGQAAALNENGSVNSAANPETRGKIVVLFGTGEGVTNPASVTGQVTTSILRRPTAPVSVRIGGQPAEVFYLGSMPGAVAGAFQLNVRIPTNIGTGPQAVDLQIGSASTQTSVTIAVQ